MTCGIEKVDGLLCKLSFGLSSHYICILSLLMHFVKHLLTSIMNFNKTIVKPGRRGLQKGFKGGLLVYHSPPNDSRPPPPNQTLIIMSKGDHSVLLCYVTKSSKSAVADSID